MKNMVVLKNGVVIEEFLGEYGNGSISAKFGDDEVGRLHFVVFKEENRIKIQHLESYKKGMNIGRELVYSVLRIAMELKIPEVYGASTTSAVGFYKKIGALILDCEEVFGDADRAGDPAFVFNINIPPTQ